MATKWQFVHQCCQAMVPSDILEHTDPAFVSSDSCFEMIVGITQSEYKKL